MKIMNTLSGCCIVIFFSITESKGGLFDDFFGSGEHSNLEASNSDESPWRFWTTTAPNNNDLTTSSKGIDLIKRSEKLERKAYLCPANRWTIGYGHTGNVKPGQVITEREAESLLKSDLKYFEKKVKELVKVPLNQNQFDALVSFTFNLGEKNLSSSTLLKKLNQRDYQGAANEFHKWNKAGKPLKVLRGLTIRRKAEADLFSSVH